MFKKKNKDKNKESPNRTTTSETSHVTQTFQNLTVRTTVREQRSQSVCYTTTSIPSGSQTSLPALPLNSTSSFLLPSRVFSHEKTKSFNNLGLSELDAKPVQSRSGVNLNYQSPYRNSPVYKSFQEPTKTRPVIVTPRTYKEPTTSAKPIPIFPSLKVPTQQLPPPKKLTVKKTGRRYDKDTPVPTYKTSSKNRGEVLIINNIMFEGEKERKGAKEDDKRLEDLFKQIGFKVQVRRDLTCKQMESTIERFSKNSSLKNADISVVVIMSHGTKHNTWGTQVFGCDEKGVPVENILNYFTADKCIHMQDKPKIFIFQCCRGDNEQFIQSDSVLAKPPSRICSDLLIAYSTLPGFTSHRDPIRGTWYIQTVCDIFSEHAHEYHVEDLLKMVDVQLANFGGVSSRQTSSYESRGFKRCYLHPQ